jgi:hypothetical protein
VGFSVLFLIVGIIGGICISLVAGPEMFPLGLTATTLTLDYIRNRWLFMTALLNRSKLLVKAIAIYFDFYTF